MKEKLTIKDLEKIMLENFVNEYGNLDISGLDFSEFNGNINISRMKVKGDLFQYNQKVGGHLFQCNQKVSRNLIQDSQKVIGELIQDCSCEKDIQLPTYPTAEIKSKMHYQLEKELAKKDPIRRLVDLGVMVHKEENVMDGLKDGFGTFEISKNGVNFSSHVNGTMSEDMLEALLDLVRELKEIEK